MTKTLGSGLDCFIVTPDNDRAAAAVECVPFEPTTIVRHASGRPWMIARQQDSSYISASTQGKSILIIGTAQVSQDRLRNEIFRCSRIHDIDVFLEKIPGTFHVVLKIGNSIGVRGTASGLRKAYYTRINGQILVGDRPHVLARLGGTTLDEAALSLRLLEPLPHPLAERVLWHGVQEVPPGSQIMLGQGSGTVEQWWTPPAPERRLHAGAAVVRETLAASVSANLAGRTGISSEFSGGFDSTSVALLAQHELTRRNSGSVMAWTAHSRDPLDDDGAWAALAARAVPALSHRVLPAEHLPLVYDDLDGGADFVLDEPSIAVASHARIRALTAAAQAHGADVHLTGHGGDNLFVGLPTLCADMLRQRPLSALRRLNAYRGMFGWHTGVMIRQLLWSGPYRRWLATATTSSSPNDWQYPILTWGIRPALPEWLTHRATDAIADEIRQAADTAVPLAPTPGRHLELDGIRDGARLSRALTDITAQTGLAIATPFLDDQVVRAALAVRLEDRVQPRRYKPLLAAAMQGVLPTAVLNRTTKGTGNLDAALGQREHKGQLTQLWAESRLAQRGLINPVALTAECANPDSPALTDGSILPTVACELWLRAAEQLETATPHTLEDTHDTPIA